MKELFLMMVIASASSSAFADTVSTSQVLQLGDSIRMYNALVKLGHTFQPDATDPALMIHQAGFTSADGAFKIFCERRVKAVDLGSECDVEINSANSNPSISTVKIGLIGGVQVVSLLSRQDVEALRKSAASPLGFFQSSETVEAKLLNGSLAKFPRLRIDCNTPQGDCQIALFPL